MKKRFLFLLFYLFIFLTGLAQSTSNQRTKIIFVSNDTVVLDTLSIIPDKFSVYNSNKILIDSVFYILDWVQSRVIFKKKIQLNDSFSFSYHVFPVLFSQERNRKKKSLLRPNFDRQADPFAYTITNQKEDVFKTDGLNKNGSISRGISFGNNQDVVVNSNLNLQLSGKLNNNIDILLAATDNNIPLQPDGNTQQLQDFDKVFIQLSDKRSKLIAGDFQLSKPTDSYFMNYYKKAQGLSFSTQYTIKENGKKDSTYLNSLISVAVSRGKFARNIINGIENNQGPYRLLGAENEPFIIVLSGTEKVYIDGMLMNRGQDNDYVIDYNTSEIVFTPKQLITKDKRIIVEFQYSDKNYARSLIQFSQQYQQKKWKMGFHLYSEQDSKNQPLQQTLNEKQKQILTNIGDSLNKAVSSSVDTVSYSNKEVLYEKKDTLLGSFLFSNIYVYSIDPTKAKYRIIFSNVGVGKGNYKQINSTANGKVYEWSAPDTITGLPTGSFEPVILLITPKKKQLYTLSSEYTISKKTKLALEFAASNNDINTFSKLDSKDDWGYGLKMNVENVRQLTHLDTLNNSRKNWQLLTNITYEYVKKEFTPIERFRTIEFERDWNRNLSGTYLGDQHIIGASAMAYKGSDRKISYLFNLFDEGNVYSGTKHNISSYINTSNYLLDLNFSYLASKNAQLNTSFLRHSANIMKKFKWFNLGVIEAQDQSKFVYTSKDSLQKNSFDFWEWEGYLASPDSFKNKYRLSYKQRSDYAVKNNRFTKSTFAENIGFSFAFLKHLNNQLSTTINYRTLAIVDSQLTQQKPDRTILGRIEYNAIALSGFITSNTFYEVGSGLEVRKEFSFIEVAPGQGTHSWSDYNSNGIKELNEFETAIFQDQARYIKIFTPSNTYIKVYNNQFSQLINIRPASVWATKKGIRKFIARFSNQMAFRTDRKTLESKPNDVFNPFSQNINDNSLVTLNTTIRNTLFFNQTSSVLGVDFNWQDVKGKTVLLNGLDSRANVFNEIRLRWNLSTIWSVLVNCKDGLKSNQSKFLSSRDFRIKYQELEPKLNYQPSAFFRTALSFKYSEKNNSVDYGAQKAIIQDFGLELKYNVLNKGSFNLKTNYLQIRYNDLQNTSVSFEMLEGLKPGNNVVWGVSYQRTLTNNMQISINYDGRKPSDVKAIHTGGAQVRAFF